MFGGKDLRMIIPKKVTFFFSLLLLIQTTYSQSSQQVEKSKKIQNSLNEIIAQEQIPGIIAAITSSNGIVAAGSAGIRKVGSSEKLTENDIVHIGSCTKAMTSLMLATLVADNTITWETKLIEALPDLKDSIPPDYHHVTLWQLLTHRAGVPANAKDWRAHGNMKLQERRIEIMKENLKDAPAIEQGEYHYSNLGYMVAACMAERLTGLTWESLMQERLFDLLDMTSAGFGPPGTPWKTDQPWGHVRSGDEWQPRQLDNAEALGPAGRVHCTVKDWASFIAQQLPDGKGKALSLDRELLDILVTPVGEYAGGWIVVKRPWGKGLVLTHSGSNTTWYATVWVAPKLDGSFIVVTNSCDSNSHAICDKMIGKLIEIDRGK